MSDNTISLKQELESNLREFVINGAQHALRDIVKYEMDELAVRDPAFADVARKAKKLLVELAELAEQGIELKVFHSVREYADILDSISQSIEDRNNGLLIDCISHLQQFVEINGKGKDYE